MYKVLQRIPHSSESFLGIQYLVVHQLVKFHHIQLLVIKF